jgi:hypothetical protein
VGQEATGLSTDQLNLSAASLNGISLPIQNSQIAIKEPYGLR